MWYSYINSPFEKSVEYFGCRFGQCQWKQFLLVKKGQKTLTWLLVPVIKNFNIFDCKGYKIHPIQILNWLNDLNNMPKVKRGMQHFINIIIQFDHSQSINVKNMKNAEKYWILDGFNCMWWCRSNPLKSLCTSVSMSKEIIRLFWKTFGFILVY